MKITIPERMKAINTVPLGEITDLYIGDLLSCVMANIDEKNLWLTTQTSMNVLAIAHLHDLAGIVFCEGMYPSKEVMMEAESKGIPLFSYDGHSYHLARELTCEN